MSQPTKTKTWLKRIIIAGVVLAAIGGGIAWYLFNEKFTATKDKAADFTVNAADFIKEFEKSDSAANKKYADKIVTVNGMVSDIESADTTLNIKMTDTTSGSYIIFAFQEQYAAEAKTVKAGDAISIKGSCSGGTFSTILEVEAITFKRCTLNK